MSAPNVVAEWIGGDLVYKDKTKTEFARFDGTNGVLQAKDLTLCRRVRTAIAQVNAGATLLPALGAGYAYRLIDAFAIAIGGAAAAVTTVDVIGTLSTARKLVAFGQAALTQSALVRAGSSGGVLLADGASFTANDANTAITIGVTGSPLTTATHIDVVLTYAIDRV